PLWPSPAGSSRPPAGRSRSSSAPPAATAPSSSKPAPTPSPRPTRYPTTSAAPSPSSTAAPQMRTNLSQVGSNGAVGATRAQLAERHGVNIAKVAAARKLLTLVYYGLRDGHIRCLARPA